MLMLLTALYVFLDPKVGQRVEYTLTQPDQSYRWSREIQAVQNGRVRLHSFKLYSGTNEWVDPRTTYWPLAKLQETARLLDDCAHAGGVREEIEVPAGKFWTCKVVSEDGDYRRVTYWWGDVPVLGLVRRVIELKDSERSQQVVELSTLSR